MIIRQSNYTFTNMCRLAFPGQDSVSVGWKVHY